MGKSSAGKLAANVAHKGSSHFAPGPPAISGGPGVTPAVTFIPGPFMYIAKSKSLHANGASGPRTTFKGKKKHRALVLGSYTDIEQPGNMPAKPGEKKPTGADLSNMVIVGISKVSKASGEAYSTDKQFAVTMDFLNLCIPGENQGTLHQAEGTLLDAADPNMSSAEAAKHKPRIKTMGNPVTVTTGEVLDEEMEIYLPGLLDLEWKRLYGSSRSGQRSPLGKGGWSHNFHQWIEPNPATGGYTLRGDEGGDVELPAVEKRSSCFHRGRRLTLSRVVDELEVYDHDTRLTREFVPFVSGGKAPLRAIEDAWGARIELDYEKERLSLLRDTAMREVRITSDDDGRITSLEVWAPESITAGVPGPLTAQQRVEYTYSDDGDLASTKDALGNGYRYRYDGRHRMIGKTLPSGLAFHYTYDRDRNRCVRSTADGGFQNVELTFDDAEGTTIVHGTPEPREFEWDEKGQVVREATFDGSFEELTEYDDDGHVLTKTDAAGEVLAFERDDHANITKATLRDGSEVTWEYQDDLIVRRVDPGDRVVELSYDHRGALLRETDWAGRWLAYTIDRYGRTTAVHDAAGLVAAYEHDAQHNIVRQTDERGGVHRFQHDTMGRLVAKTDPIGRVTRYQNDVLGRPTREEMPDGTVVEYAWDAEGNVVQTGDGRSLVDKAEYAGTGSITRRTMPDGQTWEYAYDILERLREIKNPKGEIHRFRHDRAGHLVEETTFDGQTIRYQYSRRGLLSRVEYPDDTWLEYTYDGRGFVVEEASPHGTRKYARNELGWIVEAVVEEHNGSVAAKLAWDIQGRLLEEQIQGRAVTYAYDEKTGRLASRTLPNGEVTRYFFDPAGALSALDHDGEKVLLQRDVLGRELRRHVYRSGVDMHMAYNEDDRLTHLQVSLPPQTPTPGAKTKTLVQRAWQYGPHARVRAVHDARWGMNEHDHDLAGRLLAAGYGAHRELYEYDVAGSLHAIRKGADASRDPWPLRMGNVLARSDDAKYEHDARRRRRRKIHLEDGEPTGEVTEYLWDCRSLLREVILPDGVRVLFTYDPFGRRFRKTVIAPIDPEDAMATQRIRRVDYVWDVNELAMEIDSEKGERVFVHEPGTFFPVLHREQGETFAYVTDPLGVPTESLDGEGRLAWSGAWSAWGARAGTYRDEPIATERPVETPFRLLGQVHDDDIGLASTRYRLFDPATARWLTADPFGLDGGPNLFAFDGSPTERVDALGLTSLKKFQNQLTNTHGPRRDANRAAQKAQKGPNGNGLGPRTAAASRPIPPNTGKGATSLNKGDGTACGHAERNPLRAAQGQKDSNTQSGTGAIGAGRPHCGGCTQSIIDTPGAVTSSRIRGESPRTNDGVPGTNGGWPVPDL